MKDLKQNKLSKYEYIYLATADLILRELIKHEYVSLHVTISYVYTIVVACRDR